MKNFNIGYKENSNFNEVKYITIENVIYSSNQLSNEAKELISIMSYFDYENKTEYYEILACIIGYDKVLQGILDLRELGANVASAKIYRELVMNSFKEEYKGMMRH